MTLADALIGLDTDRMKKLAAEYEYLHAAHFRGCDRWRPYKTNFVVRPESRQSTAQTEHKRKSSR